VELCECEDVAIWVGYQTFVYGLFGAGGGRENTERIRVDEDVDE
jgi:hypothetical protein